MSVQYGRKAAYEVLQSYKYARFRSAINAFHRTRIMKASGRPAGRILYSTTLPPTLIPHFPCNTPLLLGSTGCLHLGHSVWMEMDCFNAYLFSQRLTNFPFPGAEQRLFCITHGHYRLYTPIHRLQRPNSVCTDIHIDSTTEIWDSGPLKYIVQEMFQSLTVH